MIHYAFITLIISSLSVNTYSLSSLFDDVENYNKTSRATTYTTKHREPTKNRISSNKSSASIIRSSLPHYRNTRGKKTLVVNISQQRFGAYNSSGYLVKSGRVSTGKPGYRTKRGTFRSLQKRGGASCWSNKYKVGIPYCMFYHHGFALHGYHDVPSYPASRGCIRIKVDDARWLHNDFVDKNTLLIVH